MEMISVKFQEDVLGKIDESIIKHNFNSRTEFIREAVRDKLSELDKQALLEQFLKYRGGARKKTTDEQNMQTKQQVSKELMAELEKRFS
jgi:metal-responsive CopG/Arc/MetJ family transcriptional regulator